MTEKRLGIIKPSMMVGWLKILSLGRTTLFILAMFVGLGTFLFGPSESGVVAAVVLIAWIVLAAGLITFEVVLCIVRARVESSEGREGPEQLDLEG